MNSNGDSCFQNPSIAEVYTEHSTQVNVAQSAPSGFYICSGGKLGLVNLILVDVLYFVFLDGKNIHIHNNIIHLPFNKFILKYEIYFSQNIFCAELGTCVTACITGFLTCYQIGNTIH